MNRGNVLELIGKDRRKYHSAVITCFAFDLLFFEERVLPVLRIANIKNITVLVDGPYLESQFEFTSALSGHQRSYMLIPIYQKGIFHPKVMLLTGYRQGMLVIGSGNLTGAGLSANNEIWAAFQLSNHDYPHATLLKQTWKYLLDLTAKNAKGHGEQGLRWINQHSTWLQAIESVEGNWCDLGGGGEVVMLSINDNDALYGQLQAILPTEKVNEITVISPFYDTDGALLKRLMDDFKPKFFRAVIDQVSGTQPYKMLQKGINFYAWNDCLENSGRLHAKMIRFGFKSVEYLFFGSANATMAGMGLSANNNDEVCLLLRRPSGGNYLEDLDIYLPDKEITLTKPSAIGISATQTTNWEYHLQYTELEGDRLTIFVKEPVGRPLTIAFYDTEGNELFSGPCEPFIGEIQIIVDVTESVYKVALKDGNIRISNYAYAQRVEHLLKNNPDPRYEQLNELFQAVTHGEEWFVSLLSHLNFNWADEDGEGNERGKVFSSSVPKPITVDGKYEKLDEREFHNPKSHAMAVLVLSHPNLRIADFLSVLTRQLNTGYKIDFSESEEMKQLLQDDGGDGGTVTGSRKQTLYKNGEYKSVMRFFWKLHDHYESLLMDGLYNTFNTTVKNAPMGLKEISHIRVAMDIYQFFQDKKYNLEEGENLKPIPRDFFREGHFSESETPRWVLSDILGKFLLLCPTGFKKYDSPLLDDKLKRDRQEFFVTSLHAVLNCNWGASGQVYRNVLILNLLFFMEPHNGLIPIRINAIKERLASIRSEGTVKETYAVNLSKFEDELLPSFLTWLPLFDNINTRKELLTDISSITSGTLIFRQSLGFAEIRFKRKVENGNYTINVNAPGLDWNEEQQLNMLSGIPVGSKLVCFIY